MTHTQLPWRLYHFEHPGSPPTLAIMATEKKSHNEVVHWAGFDSSHFPEQAPANAAFIVKAVNSHEALVKALQGIIDANKEFRAGMPDGWEGDPLQDACEEAEAVLGGVGGVRVP